MLGRKHYTQEEIDTGRAMVEADPRAYRRDHEPLYSENGWTHFTTQKGYTMKLKLMSVFVDDQDKALKFYTDVLGFAKKLDFPTRTPPAWCARQ